MSYDAKDACPAPGCGRYTAGGYCAEHAPQPIPRAERRRREREAAKAKRCRCGAVTMSDGIVSKTTALGWHGTERCEGDR